MLTNEQIEEFNELSKPLVKVINENLHPHAIAIISPDRADIFEGLYGVPIREFIGN